MGKIVRCHFGEFHFPSEVLGIEIDDDSIGAFCKDVFFRIIPLTNGRIKVFEFSITYDDPEEKKI